MKDTNLNLELKLPAISASAVELGTIVVSLALIAGSLYFSWHTVQVSSKSEPAVAAEAETPIPELKLNRTHARQGAIVPSDPQVAGKADPFK